MRLPQSMNTRLCARKCFLASSLTSLRTHAHAPAHTHTHTHTFLHYTLPKKKASPFIFALRIVSTQIKDVFFYVDLFLSKQTKSLVRWTEPQGPKMAVVVVIKIHWLRFFVQLLISLCDNRSRVAVAK